MTNGDKEEEGGKRPAETRREWRRIYALKLFQNSAFKFLFPLMANSLKDPAHATVSIPSVSIPFLGAPGKTLGLIISSTNGLRSSVPRFWQSIVLCCAVLYHLLCACPYSLDGIQHLLQPPPTVWLRHPSIVFGTAHIQSAVPQIIQGAPHLYYLKLNSPYPSVL